MDKKQFIDRLIQLRMSRDISARDMSLSLGQGTNYINNIESGRAFPSMTMFFYICEYLGITPQEFFDTHNSAPCKLDELMAAAKSLSREQIELLISMAKQMQK